MINFIKCPYCFDMVQEKAFEIHTTGFFMGKKLYDKGTCFKLQSEVNN